MANQGRTQQIAEMTETLNQTVTHPEFVSLLEQLQEIPEDQRKQFVRDEMDTEALAKKGVPVPGGLRSTVRVFEDPESAVLSQEAVEVSKVEPAAEPTETVCVSVGFVVCVSYGQSKAIEQEE